jgi:hypothetical protein
LVELSGQGINRSQSHYLHRTTQTHIHASSGIQTHDHSVWTGEDISCLRQSGHCDWQKINKFPQIQRIYWLHSYHDFVLQMIDEHLLVSTNQHKRRRSEFVMVRAHLVVLASLNFSPVFKWFIRLYQNIFKTESRALLNVTIWWNTKCPR